MKALQTHAMGQPRKQHPHHMVLRGLRKHDAEVARRGIHDEIARTGAPILAYLREQQDEAAPVPGPVAARGRRTAGQLA
jgi:hypothetical protein